MKYNYSINKNTQSLIDDLIKNKFKYGIEIFSGPLNCLIIDAGINVLGSIEAGIKISEICMAGLGKINICTNDLNIENKWNINVRASNPVLACLGCQYAGWSLNFEKFFSLGSGPARSIAQREDIFKEINYSDTSNKTSLILEVSRIPPLQIVEKVSKDCKIQPQNICFILTPTNSMAGNIQIVSRVLEVAIHKVHELKFPLDRIVDGMGTCPIPPVASNFLTGMGRTNDSIIYGGSVFMTLKGPSEDLKDLSKKLPSENSKDYGKPFKKIFQKYNGDFYKIDGALFSPAKIILNSLETGESFINGSINEELLEKSFLND